MDEDEILLKRAVLAGKGYEGAPFFARADIYYLSLCHQV